MVMIACSLRLFIGCVTRGLVGVLLVVACIGLFGYRLFRLVILGLTVYDIRCGYD